MRKILALLVAVCLIMSLAVPAFATEVDPSETTAATVDTTASTDATEDTTGTAEDTAATDDTTAAVEEHDHDHDHTEDKESSPVVKAVRIVLIVLEVIASVALIIVVLAQSGKESGLSGALTGNSDSYMNKNGKGGLDKTLAKATKWVALAWVLLTLALGLVSLL